MIDEKKLQETIDRNEIINLICKSMLTRDSGRWEDLASCYHSSADFVSSWYQGKASDFFKAADEQLEKSRRDGGEQKHVTSNHWVQINGDRAIAECDLILFMRTPIDGVPVDFSTWSRRLQLIERENGDWKIRRRWVIYERDRMDAVDPTVGPDSYYDAEAVAKYGKQIPYHLWRNELLGVPPAKEICLKGTESEKTARAAAREWLAGK